MTIEELKEKREKLKHNSDITLDNMDKIITETNRVADVAHNSREILEELDREFELQTGLDGKDIAFLFVAIALQLARIFIINELTKIEPAGAKGGKEDKLHEWQKKLLNKYYDGQHDANLPYYATMRHIITTLGVPYDATAPLTQEAIDRLKKKGSFWDIDLSDFIAGEKMDLFKGANHRFSTLGHDPILGLVFGTGNIMTNTITCVKSPISVGNIGIPILTTNHVIYDGTGKNPRIGTYGSIGIMLKSAIERVQDQPEVLAASLIKQIIHIGTDAFTTCGIQIPGANLVLSNSEAEKLTKYISAGDIIKIGTSAKVAEFINWVIGSLHTLTYNPELSISREIYSVKTRKILMYSNVIATGSNVIWTAINVMGGNESAIKQLDIGGLIVTIKRLISDKEYIRQIKEEFILGGFKQMIRGSDLELEEPIWD